jgi:hypothetical protein
MIDPRRNFAAFAASLRRAGFEVVRHSAPWSPDYLRVVAGGKAQLYLLGWVVVALRPAFAASSCQAGA